MKHLESSESSQIKSQNDRLSPKIPHKSLANFQVPARVCNVEGGAAWIPGLRSLTPTMALVGISNFDRGC